MRPAVLACTLASMLPLIACTASTDEGDVTTDADEAELAGNAKKINIGFNAGFQEQLQYLPDFNTKTSIHLGPRLCHEYVDWRVAEGAGSKNANLVAEFNKLGSWLGAAQGVCDEALISFKSTATAAAPSVSRFETDFKLFLDTDWKTITGFEGTMSFTAWNEPNNPEEPGNGLGVVIEPETAAGYWLAASRQCKLHGGCKVAAGDFASNGNWWNAYEQNCKDDTVAPKDLCNTLSDVADKGAKASYLDRYKNFIVNHVTDYGFGKSFKPEYFAFHGWHDANMYLKDHDHASDYDTSVVRRVLRSLQGGWGGAKIWDTEVGVDQSATDTIDDDEQACGAAFLLRLHAISPRIERMYYTRLHNGGDKGGALLDGKNLRPAGKVLAERKTSYTFKGGKCK